VAQVVELSVHPSTCVTELTLEAVEEAVHYVELVLEEEVECCDAVDFWATSSPRL
jgi:hypothetical protein